MMPDNKRYAASKWGMLCVDTLHIVLCIYYINIIFCMGLNISATFIYALLPIDVTKALSRALYFIVNR